MAVAALVTWVVTAGFGFTAHADGEWMTRAAQVGASGFIPKYGSLAEMISMLKVAKPGRMSVPPSMLHTGAAQTAANHQLLAGLILRELEVLGYMGWRRPKAVRRTVNFTGGLPGRLRLPSPAPLHCRSRG
jgi:hypothetical protein